VIAAAYLIVLRDGRGLRAVKPLETLAGGWVRARTIRTRVDYDEDADLGVRVFDRIVTRRFSPTAIREVIELDGDDQAHDAEAAVAFP
jgi:hypothetical protein